MSRQPDAVPTPSTTMTGVTVVPARMEVDDVSKRIVYLRFKRDIYSDCHMMIAPLGAIVMGLDLIFKAVLALIWIGNPAGKRA